MICSCIKVDWGNIDSHTFSCLLSLLGKKTILKQTKIKITEARALVASYWRLLPWFRKIRIGHHALAWNLWEIHKIHFTAAAFMKTESLSASASALSTSLETRHSVICKGSGLGLTCFSRTHVVVVLFNFCSSSQHSQVC